MTITYDLNKESAAIGVSRSYAHRCPARRILIPSFGGLLIALSLRYLIADESSGWLVGSLLLFAGVIYIFSPIQRKRKVVENMFAGRPENLSVEMKTTEEGIAINTPESNGTVSWSSFVDSKICKGGALLYPQKSMHFWIPDTATVQDGTWQDFQDLISKRITRKI